ncbi:hypothetical protein [uncultured Bilophila sp.]|uniref:hypothetical protein n=1 Tax=uncultured Bilophila sp. TaxID=529385 RepID=UPI002597B24F|nr:hypothetical protein [uncultured Bilophila sp.]
MRVLGDLEVAGEAAPHFAVALALVLLRQHADLGVDQCLELRLCDGARASAGGKAPSRWRCNSASSALKASM